MCDLYDRQFLAMPGYVRDDIEIKSGEVKLGGFLQLEVFGLRTYFFTTHFNLFDAAPYNSVSYLDRL